jgi:hypothetical protein
MVPVDQVTEFYDTVVQDYLAGCVCWKELVVLGVIQLFIDHPTLGHNLHIYIQKHYFGIGRVKNIQNSDPLLI